MQTTTTGTIRSANRRDASEIARLIGMISPAPKPREAELFDRGYLLVLDLGDRLGGIVHVDVDHDRHATMDLLVIDPELSGSHLEDRISGVAHALCEAYGCDHVDTCAEPRQSRGRR